MVLLLVKSPTTVEVEEVFAEKTMIVLWKINFYLIF